jgi:hypothetical protein
MQTQEGSATRIWLAHARSIFISILDAFLMSSCGTSRCLAGLQIEAHEFVPFDFCDFSLRLPPEIYLSLNTPVLNRKLISLTSSRLLRKSDLYVYLPSQFFTC